MTNETLQQKIDANFRRLCEFHFDGYQAELDTWTETNEALQEFREQIKKLHRIDYLHSQHEYVDLKDVLALIGEKSN